MTWVEVEVERSRTIAADRDTLWRIVGDVERHGDLMPRVERFEPVDGGWRWVMEEERRFGQRFQPRFTVRYTLSEPDEVRFEKHEAPDDSADAAGAITLREDGEGATSVTFRIDLGFEAGIPSMLAGPARSMLRGEVEGLVTGFLDNVESAAST